MKYILSIVLFAISILSFAQPAEDLLAFKDKYPESYSVYTEYADIYTIDIVDGAVDIVKTHKEETIYLHEYRAKFAKGVLAYSSFDEVLDYSGYSLIPTKKRYKKIKVKEFKEKDLMGGAIFYDDYKQISCTFPNMKEGGKSYWEYTKRMKTPKLLGSFYFASGDPIEHGVCEVKVHQDIDLDYQLFNTDSLNVDFSQEKEGKYNILRWTVKEVKPIDNESSSLGYHHVLPHVAFRIKNYIYKGEKIPVLENLDGLHAWYREFIEDIVPSKEDVLQPIVDSLLANEEDELAKVKILFYWVQDNIKYIAFEDGMRGFIPESASKVCEARYGDCKGKSNILVEMMRLADIKGYYTWIGTRDLPYRYEETPSPIVDNHMIATYINDGDYYFLDGTAENLPFGFPTGFIQGKEALISLDSANYIVKEVPVVASEKNQYNSTITLSMEGDKLIGHAEMRISGYYKIMHYTPALKGLSGDDLKERIERMFQIGNNKFDLIDFSVKDVEEKDSPLLVTVNFTIEDYLYKNENEFYLNMNLSKVFAQDRIKDDRKYSIEEDFEGIYASKIIFNLPEGASVDYLPEDSNFEHALFNYGITYEVDSVTNQIICDKKYETNHIVLEKEQFEDWNTMIKKLKNAYNESILFKTK